MVSCVCFRRSSLFPERQSLFDVSRNLRPVSGGKVLAWNIHIYEENTTSVLWYPECVFAAVVFSPSASRYLTFPEICAPFQRR